MTRFKTTTAVALAAGLCTAPALAQQDRQQDRMQNQQMSQQGQACIDNLERIDQRLAGIGYGRPGPGGYGVYGTPYRATAVDARAEGTGALDRPLRITPRADMYALMRAGYVMAQTGHAQGCQQVVQAAQNLGDRYQAALQDEDFDRSGMAQWRRGFLADATPVTGLDQPMTADEIIGADLRNLQDRDLGDITDVVIGADGRIDYAIVQTGGFLGFGEDEVPVPWQDLKVTAAPYRDTFVLNVDQQTFSEAPRLQNGNRTQLVSGQGGRNVDSFWNNNLDGEG